MDDPFFNNVPFALDETENHHFAPEASYEANDTLETATPIGEGTYNISGQNVDWYELDSLSGTIDIKMTPTGGKNLHAIIYNDKGQVLRADLQSGTAQENPVYLAPKDGTYYLKVINAQYGHNPPDGTPLDYKLEINLPTKYIPGPNDPGETLDTATAIDAGSRDVKGSGLDWFRFETGPGKGSISMTPTGGTPPNLNIELYNDKGQVIKSNFTSGREAFEFLAPDEGTYYLKVYNAAYPKGAPNGMTWTYDLELDLPQKTWAKTFDFGPVRDSSVAVYDIDNDGKDEIFIGTSKTLDAEGNEIRPAGLIVLEDDGTVKWTKTFPGATGPDPKTGKTYQTTSVSTAPIFSDVNGDNKIDILIGVGADNAAEFGSVGQPGDKGGLYALDANGETLWYHQTHDTFGDDNRPDGVYGAPIVFDIDRDGIREVLYQSWDHHFYILDGRNGTVEQDTDQHDTAGATPALADLNGDGLMEIVAPADITDNPKAGIPKQGGILHVFNNYSQPIVPGWDQPVGTATAASFRGKFEEQSLWSSPQIVDLDKDGTVEIIQGTGNFFQDGRGQYIKVWNADGTLRFKLDTDGRAAARPLIADLNGDGRMEIIAGTLNGHVHAWNAQGKELFNTKISAFNTNSADALPIARGPIAVDIDNANGDLEILVTAGPQIIVLDSDGTQITSDTSPELFYHTYNGSPVARDIDHDGKLDLISGGSNDGHTQAKIYRFENLTDTTASEYRTAVYQEHQSLHAIREFVERFYSKILGRDADPQGSNMWTDRLYSGVKTGADVARGFILSSEFTSRNTTNEEFVETLYTAFFNRAADDGGLKAWVERLDNGQSRETVLNGFIRSQEFANLARSFGILPQVKVPTPDNGNVIVGNSTDPSYLRAGDGNNTLYTSETLDEQSPHETRVSGQVFRLYGATLGRTPDTKGFTNWFDAIAEERVSLENAANGFVKSAEFQKTYGNLDDTAFVTLLYKNVLDRAPDPAGLKAWEDRLSNGMSRAQVVIGFSNSGEYQQKTNELLDSFMRTTNVSWLDVLEGGAGNDTMNGGTGSDSFVFYKGEGGEDVIKGFEPWDRLQLSRFGYSKPSDALGKMTQQGADVVFEDQGQKIIFENMRLNDMKRVEYNLS